MNSMDRPQMLEPYVLLQDDIFVEIIKKVTFVARTFTEGRIRARDVNNLKWFQWMLDISIESVTNRIASFLDARPDKFKKHTFSVQLADQWHILVKKNWSTFRFQTCSHSESSQLAILAWLQSTVGTAGSAGPVNAMDYIRVKPDRDKTVRTRWMLDRDSPLVISLTSQYS